MDNVTGSTQVASAADRRARQRERTRRRILEAALELFCSRGYASTTMDDIADRADIARRTLFNHFPAKQAILAADIPLTIVLVQGRMTEITDARELFPSFEPLQAAVRLGQDQAEFSTSVSAGTVA